MSSSNNKFIWDGVIRLIGLTSTGGGATKVDKIFTNKGGQRLTGGTKVDRAPQGQVLYIFTRFWELSRALLPQNWVKIYKKLDVFYIFLTKNG